MRVLYFSRSYTAHDYRFLKALSEAGQDIYFLYLEDGGVVQDKRSLPPRVKLINWAEKDRWRSWPDDLTPAIQELSRIVEEYRPDIVHAGPIPTCAYIAAAAKAQPLMAVSWGSDLLVDANRTETLHDRTCFALNHSQMLLADCDEVARKARELTGYPADRIVQFPWGVELDTFKPGAEHPGLRNQFEADSFILLSTRSWEYSYGILHLLDGFLEARSTLPQLKLFLLGDGSLRPEIEAFVRENRLENVIRMPGQIPSAILPEYYRAVDLYVSCTFSDGSSISLLEAMATGLPVIATDRDSNREWFEENDGGLLVKFGDSRAIRNAIVTIASMDETHRRAWGNRNLAVAQERADWKKNFQKLLTGYEKMRLLVGTPGSAPERNSSMPKETENDRN